MTLVPTDDCKETRKSIKNHRTKPEVLWDQYGKYLNIKFNSDHDLLLKIIVIRSDFHEGNKYHPQAFLDECLYKV